MVPQTQEEYIKEQSIIREGIYFLLINNNDNTFIVFFFFFFFFFNFQLFIFKMEF